MAPHPALRRLVTVPVELVLVLVGNDVHIASLEFSESFSHSCLLVINNKALASRRRIVFSHFFYESSIGCVEYFAWVYAE